MIHVAYRLWGGDSFFAKMLAVSMLSMFENTKEKVTVHIMHNCKLTEDNRNKFCQIANQYNQQIEFYDVEKIAGETLKKCEEAVPISPNRPSPSWYPLIIPEVFPSLDKIIFFGADTIVNLDIAELWAYEVSKEVGFAAVPESLSGMPNNVTMPVINGEVQYEDYFNNDVMVINSSFIKDKLQDIIKACKFVQDNNYYCAEQDALNILYSKQYLHLPKKFNTLVKYLRQNSYNTLEKAIYHFADSNYKPDLNTDDVYNRLFLEYFLKTPYANVDMFGNIDKVCKKIFKRTYKAFKENIFKCKELLAGENRAFFFDKNKLDTMRKTLDIKDDELIIDTSDPKATGNLLTAMKEHRGKKVFFILFDNYFALSNTLAEYDFVENRDFVNLVYFLSDRDDINIELDTKEIVQAL